MTKRGCSTSNLIHESGKNSQESDLQAGQPAAHYIVSSSSLFRWAGEKHPCGPGLLAIIPRHGNQSIVGLHGRGSHYPG